MLGDGGWAELPQGPQMGLMTEGREAAKMHGRRWGGFQVEGIPGQRC